MNVTVFDALSPSPSGPLLLDALASRHAHLRVWALHDARFAPCEGCFGCWITHPGTCHAHDDANAAMREMMSAHEVVWLVRPSFGGWSSDAKKLLDKTIGLVLPFFTTVQGETHHLSRYPRFPRIGVVAEVARGTPAAETDRFRTLVERNALNMHSERPWVAFVEPNDSVDLIRARVVAARAEGDEVPPPPPSPPAPFRPRPDAVGVPPRVDGRARRAVLLVGSARPTGESTSERLGRALLARLNARGWESTVVPLQKHVKLPRADAPALVGLVRSADLLVLATPVYVDTLPAIVIAALERLEEALREGRGARLPALLPIVQSGFPELAHTTLALHTLAAAADMLGLGWAGHLAMGGGMAIADARLDTPRGVAAHQVRALDAAAAALDAGEAVPAEVSALFATPPVPVMVYRAMGEAGWWVKAWKEGGLMHVFDKPIGR